MKIKVGLVKCADYEEIRVYEAVKKVSEIAGGFSSFLKPGMKVLVKPNLLTAFKPEAAVTTHPLVIKAVIRLVKEHGAIPSIGDCHGGILIGKEMLLDETGMTAVAKETGTVIEGLEKMGSDDYDGIVLTRAIKNYDVIINVAKMKTHMLTVMTGAVKNLFGLIPGMNKAGMHRTYQDPQDFSKMLSRLPGLVKPAFNIIDGIVGMEGEGPSGGTPRQIGVLIASVNPFAADVVAAKLMDLDPLTVPVLKHAVSLGLKIEDIEVVGEEVLPLVVKNYKMPVSYNPSGIVSSPGLLKKIIKLIMPFAWYLATVKPKIDNKRCQKCNECIKACPVKAISYVKGFPKVKRNKCIECYCCHELCPHRAISLHKGFFVNVWLSRQRPKK